MATVTILTESELRRAAPLDRAAVDVVEGAFAALAGGDVVMPPPLGMALPAVNGEVDVKTAWVPGLDGFAIKVSPGFFDNPKRGLPSLNGLMVVLDATSGIVSAVLLDNGYLTDLRTAAAGAVAARHLAPAQVRRAGVIGAGVQAELQLRALALVRDFDEAVVWARDRGKAEALADRLAAALDRPVRAVDDAADCVRDSQVVITATPARSPVLRAAWLRPGTHVTAMGSDSAEKNELEPAVLGAADRVVCDRLAQSLTIGELRAVQAAGLPMPDATEIGAVCAGAEPGRRAPSEITVCDLTGTGVQDTAIASHARTAAARLGLGRTVAA